MRQHIDNARHMATEQEIRETQLEARVMALRE